VFLSPHFRKIKPHQTAREVSVCLLFVSFYASIRLLAPYFGCVKKRKLESQHVQWHGSNLFVYHLYGSLRAKVFESKTANISFTNTLTQFNIIIAD
jgi:hypothetical protein